MQNLNMYFVINAAFWHVFNIVGEMRPLDYQAQKWEW